MKKKITIGCIGVVVILVLASFVSIVGYQSVQSSSVKDSPLFEARTKKAINEQSKELTCNYLGKGETNAIPFPVRDNKTASLERIVDSLCKMDDAMFNRYIALVIARLHQDDTLKNVNALKLITALHWLRDNSDAVRRYISEGKIGNTPQPLTSEEFITVDKWVPGCWLFIFAMDILLSLIFLISVMIYTCFSDTCHWCSLLPQCAFRTLPDFSD